MSQQGVNLLMQRWVHHNSRVIVPTHEYQVATGSQFDEADIIEEWWIDRAEDGVLLNDAVVEIDTWLTGDRSVSAPRSRLEDPQQRSSVRRDVRELLVRQSVACPDSGSDIQRPVGTDDHAGFVSAERTFWRPLIQKRSHGGRGPMASPLPAPLTTVPTLC